MSGEQGANDPPILGYAARPVQGSPEWDKVLRDMIEANASPREIRPYFASDVDALSYFRVAMLRRFSDDQAVGACIVCSTEPAPKVAVVVWTAEILYRTLEFATSPSPKAIFSTSHPVCHDCARESVRRRKVHRYLILIPMAAIVGTILFGSMWRIQDQTRRGAPAWVIVGFAASLGLFLISYLYSKLRRPWPQRLHMLMPEGVKLIRIREVLTREPAGGQA